MDRNKELDGKVAIVTGSGRNIGKAVAEELARAGAAVTINAANDQKACKEVARDIVNSGGRAIPVMADITDKANVDNLIYQTIKSFGGVDILILNAAIRIDTPFLERSFNNSRKH